MPGIYKTRENNLANTGNPCDRYEKYNSLVKADKFVYLLETYVDDLSSTDSNACITQISAWRNWISYTVILYNSQIYR